eukprot:GEZU01010710.1.p1 GENE.GEZU01010710.1~~GEZU01010710.1.p1  ORF type:complete len:133 (-),score=34.32 GEZU01010710.1:90-449(-)
MPPPMRLCEEMIEGMGGRSSPSYTAFKLYCCEAFKILRAPQNSHMILTIFSMMIDGIPQLSGDRDKVYASLARMEEKFMLNSNNEQASARMLQVIRESENAIFATVNETFHKLAQQFKG